MTRTRFAPSPTGLMHIGGVRTALFNYFFAKASGGKFYLRIEDTDRTRLNPESIADIYATFEWLGIKLDEGPKEGGPYGPYIQSERLSLYKDMINTLFDKGVAYPCFCQKKTVETSEDEDEASVATGYDRKCRDIPKEEAIRRIEAKEPHVWRFKIPLEGTVTVKDILLGDVVFKNSDIPVDPIIMKSDGFPTYHLAHLVDDMLMETTHVLRGQEWLPSAPLHTLMFQSIGATPPIYAHLSMIVGKDGKKLSKRHGATSAIQFRNGGYIKEAILNYVTLLGWSFDGEKSIFTKEDFEKDFDLKKLSKGNAMFDYDKLNYYNAYWIRQLGDDELFSRVVPYISDTRKLGIVRLCIPFIKERITLLTDVEPMLKFMFDRPEVTKDKFASKKQTADEALEGLKLFAGELEKLNADGSPITAEKIDTHFKSFCEERKIKMNDIMGPARVAITGSNVSPPLAPIIAILGFRETMARISPHI